MTRDPKMIKLNQTEPKAIYLKSGKFIFNMGQEVVLWWRTQKMINFAARGYKLGVSTISYFEPKR